MTATFISTSVNHNRFEIIDVRFERSHPVVKHVRVRLRRQDFFNLAQMLDQLNAGHSRSHCRNSSSSARQLVQLNRLDHFQKAGKVGLLNSRACNAPIARLRQGLRSAHLNLNGRGQKQKRFSLVRSVLLNSLCDDLGISSVVKPLSNKKGEQGGYGANGLNPCRAVVRIEPSQERIHRRTESGAPDDRDDCDARGHPRDNDDTLSHSLYTAQVVGAVHG